MAKLPGLTEYYATLGAPAINFGRGLLGYQDPVGTETMQNRMTEIEAGRTKGNVGYEDYGLTPVAGRMVGGLPELAVNNPTDFALAGSIGKYDFSPEGRTGLNYDFTPDQDTGSTGNAMLDYVNSGGVRNSLSNLKNSFSNMGSAQASEMPVGPMSNLERDFPGMSTGDIIDSMNNRQSANRFSGMQFGPNKSNMNTPTIDRSNVIGKDLEADDGAQIVDGLTSPYTIRGQLKRDFLQGGLFRDAKQSLGQTKDAFLEDVSGLRNIIGSGFDKFSQGIGSLKDRGLDLGRMAISGIGSLLGAGPLGTILSRLPQEPLFRETLANSRKANPLGTRGVGPNGVQLDGVSDFGGFTTDDLGRITNNGLNYNTPEGIMSGYNAGFDLAGSALGRIGKIKDGLALGKFKNVNKANQKINNLKTAAVASAQAKRQAYQDKMDRAKNSAARERARAKSITAGYGGGNDNDRPSTGPTSVGAGMGVGGGYASDYGFKKDGGMIGYRNGGLASMFTRRR